MRILLIGSGGREHAISWKLSKSDRVSKIFVAPGNGGTEIERKCENINITDIDKLLDFAKKEKIDLTIVGPEEPLIKGIVNKFKKENLKIFGPDKAAAMLEGSKSFSKDFMKKYDVKTAGYEVFYDYEKAKEYLEISKYPLVIKADGLAAGKGVVIAKDKDEAIDTLKEFMLEDIFKGAGKKIIIEEFLEGIEASILSICDGKTILPFLSAKDHKQIYDDNKGPNTGGMGVVAPNPYVTDEVLEDFKKNIMDKTLKGIKEEGFDFKGIIFFGIMITKEGVKLLEYNVRMGDPETQSILYLMENDFLDVILKALDEDLENVRLSWKKGYALNVVLSAKGYPKKPRKGDEITIKKESKENIFIAGANLEGETLKTSGGRVLSVVGIGETLEKARENVYNLVKDVDFDGAYYRKDIGKAK